MNLTYIYVIGAAQGLFLAIALLMKTANRRSNKVLAIWMLCLVFDLTVKSIYLVHPSVYILPPYTLAHFFPFLYGSFFFLYVRTITLKKLISWKDSIHFVGFVLMAGVNLPWIFNPLENGPRGWVSFDLMLYLYSVSYVVAGLVSIKKYRATLHQQQSNTDGISLLWVDVMAYFQVIIWLIAVSQWLIPIQSYNVWVIYVAVSVYMMVMGYLALLQQNVKPLKRIKAPKMVEDERFPEVDAKLSELMGQEKMFLDPTLNIGQLAKKLGYPEYLVSLVINQVHRQTFREYINELRVTAAKQMLQDPLNKQTILDVAYDCGFTSKSTFNSAFKRITQATPSEFKSAQRH